ncbi:hypothetical protein GRT64_000147 [Salmonella enterica]|uniref:DUF2746 domain-containing protein n=3 Tax=Salmonella enterica TaxID=28901 RepID=A0A5U6T504_SALER|nr:hypothetical protein [Salmonella enterica]EAA8092119.1 hypothetical protein [Salmonella enterica subsp. enterica serovar Molade]EBF9651095.1 hypothetical protein [Salmonella enterica subsp. enterica serovar Idikan]EBV7305327.1 hypothetical protein [Salmonella enterica subsp. enterica serovar Lexington]EBW1418893.1 hypothetical protein [Salmonella enterica subsp. enterica serovar Mbandaka]EBW1526884.1 hypothetical protein [Salmonella enterica subsp. enterica serovar Meleagridis]EBY3429154.1
MEWLAIGALAATVIGLIGKFTNWTFSGVKRYEHRIGMIESKLKLLEQRTETIEDDILELKLVVKEISGIKVELAQIKTILEVLERKI